MNSIKQTIIPVTQTLKSEAVIQSRPFDFRIWFGKTLFTLGFDEKLLKNIVEITM